MPRILEELCTSSVACTSYAVGVTVRDGKAVGFSESSGRERWATADVETDGSISHSLQGKPSIGEEGTFETCRMLAAQLNANGGCWREVVLSELPHTDALIRVDVGSDKNALRVQVVRAMVDPAFWTSLTKTGLTNGTEPNADDAANYAFAAIKLKVEKIPPSERGKLLLALNGIETPFVCFPRVIESLVFRFGNEISGFGFREVWLVGPQPELVSRLNV